MTGHVKLEGMRFVSRHGVYPGEKLSGNSFTVDLDCEYELSRAVESDDLSDTVDHAELYRIVSAQMQQPSDLLEHVAGRIIAAVRERYPDVLHVEVGVYKEHPPVGGPVERSGVTIKI